MLQSLVKDNFWTNAEKIHDSGMESFHAPFNRNCLLHSSKRTRLTAQQSRKDSITIDDQSRSLF